MSKKIRIKARVEDGKLIAQKGIEFSKIIKNLEGKEFYIEIVEEKKGRSANQNAYYWSLLTIVGEELGYTKEEVHEAFKNIFLTSYDEKLPKVKSTTKLSTVDMEDYLQKIRVYCLTELNINLPLPHENI